MSSLSPQVHPVIMKTQSGTLVSGLKVDNASIKGRKIELSGWATHSCDLELWSGDRRLNVDLTRQSRPDVAQVLKQQESGTGFGFSLAANSKIAGIPSITLRVLVKSATGAPQQFDYPIRLAREGDFLELEVSPSVDSMAELGLVYRSPLTGDLIVQGWLSRGREVQARLETDAGQFFCFTNAFWFPNLGAKMHERGRFGASGINCSNFLLRCTQVEPCRRLKIVISTPQGSEGIVLDEMEVDGLELDPILAAKRLFAIASPASGFTERASLVDAPILSDLLAHDRTAWARLPLSHCHWGEPIESPQASVVVPLHGRLDFVEHQLIEFSRDPWLLAHVQLIYVLDDENMLESLTQQAEQWFKLYGVPFEWVFGGVNRGYSGANNLGASRAKGAFLVFLNSDAIPREPGWLAPLCQALEDDPKLGIVGARLLYPDGSLQHAGMTFERREAWGVWINHHPLLGCPPALDPAKGITRVPAVTGACMALKRETFEAAGGWDTGYLVGDFEDSDLCFKVRQLGLDIGYLPTVELTHLERQSFKLLGQGDFRQRVVIYNAARHQHRWGEQIAALAKGAEGAEA